MLTEILIYIALFAFLFSGAFTCAFQATDAISYLRIQQENFDYLRTFSMELDNLVAVTSDWGVLSKNTIENLIPIGSDMKIDSFFSEILDTSTSSSKVLLLTVGVTTKTSTFYYAKEK